jgi:hypothetical protein
MHSLPVPANHLHPGLKGTSLPYLIAMYSKCRLGRKLNGDYIYDAGRGLFTYCINGVSEKSICGNINYRESSPLN